MLIIPLTGKISWHNPPIVTLIIILLNCLVFFIWQSDDNETFQRAKKYYFTSGLAKIEVPRYVKYLDTDVVHKDVSVSQASETMDRKTLVRISRKMDSNYRFIRELQNDEIITPKDQEYSKWKTLRKNYDDKLSRVTFLNFGFRPAYRRPITFISYMFLHGGFSHLLGNMIFLWLVGCMLEMRYGRLLLFSIYTIGGLSSVVLFWLVNMESIIPLVGASGAISGIMGAYTVLFGKSKVKIFYYLGFYFNYLKVPAIILLPIWIGNEFYQLFFSEAVHVAYVAHIGGLAGGALSGYVGSRFLGISNDEIIHEQPNNELSFLIEKALQCISDLDMEGGRRYLRQALTKDPGNIDALMHLFNIEKQHPESHEFHDVTKSLLSLLIRNIDTHEVAYKTYEEYIRLAKHPRLSPELYLRMSTISCEMGQLESAGRILTALINKQLHLPGISTSLLKLAAAYRERGMISNWERYGQMICSRYADSPEARIIRESIKA